MMQWIAYSLHLVVKSLTIFQAGFLLKLMLHSHSTHKQRSPKHVNLLLCTRQQVIKIASTWEGIKAAEQLEREGIHCNLTLLFGFSQAVACAQAGVKLISPFVGRIYDWYKVAHKVDDIAPEDDPGVASVSRIFHYYKRHGYKTEVMGASFRKVTQITNLCGCDLLTIAPDLIDKLAQQPGDIPHVLRAEQSSEKGESKVDFNEPAFRWNLNEDAMATEKLAEGIRKFNADARKLESLLKVG